MALIKCPECGSDVSDVAKACPKCGYPMPQQNTPDETAVSKKQSNIPEVISKYKIPIIAVLAVIIVFVLVRVLFPSAGKAPEGFSQPVYEAAVRYVRANERFISGKDKEFTFDEKDSDLLHDVFQDSLSAEKYTVPECVMGEQFGQVEFYRLMYIAGSHSITEYEDALSYFKDTIDMK